MKSAKILLSSLLLLILIGCTSTVTPVQIRASAPSIDVGGANSGELAILPDGRRVLTAHAIARYETLCKQYGAKFSPQLDGLEAHAYAVDSWTLDAEHFAKFAIMNHWGKEGVK